MNTLFEDSCDAIFLVSCPPALNVVFFHQPALIQEVYQFVPLGRQNITITRTNHFPGFPQTFFQQGSITRKNRTKNELLNTFILKLVTMFSHTMAYYLIQLLTPLPSVFKQFYLLTVILHLLCFLILENSAKCITPFVIFNIYHDICFRFSSVPYFL